MKKTLGVQKTYDNISSDRDPGGRPVHDRVAPHAQRLADRGHTFEH